ncbi:MAG: TlpA family protein disulfide reductase [Ignavibacteriae bacterium]|nr:TlpA family protein disulfide reductase [Ignavibacteriota bacterium]
MFSLGLLSFLLIFSNPLQQPQKVKAPDFTLKTSDGKTVQLSKLKGKVVLVNFWATWCGPCKAEIPDFMEVYSSYKSKGFEIVGIALDEEGWEVVKPYSDKQKINYPIVLGDGPLAYKYGGIEAIPTSFLVDQDGYIVGKRIGLLQKELLENSLKKLLALNTAK